MTRAPVADAGVHDLLAAQAARTPHAIAVIDRGRTLTYAQLDRRANALAHRLIALGVAREAPVGVGCARSAELIIAVVAVCKAGAAYVPLDPDHPPERHAYVIADAAIAVVIAHGRVGDRFAHAGVTVVAVDDDEAIEPPAIAVTGDDAIYVLYTSGSTGAPKGVVGLHRAITGRLRWAQAHYPYGLGEVACARTPLGFVDSVAELFAPLAFGVPLVVIDDAIQRDPTALLAALAAAAVTRIVVVPSQLAALLDLHPDLGARVPALRWWFVGGEPVPVALVARFAALVPGCKLINIYGATELSGDATAYDFDAMPPGLINAPIGTALSGVWVRVVDDELRELPAPAVGEICVSGVCVARGYLGRPELTAARFVPNPFPEGGALYRTGDLGRVLPSGDLEYLGRRDQQVKVRGVRIELGEVEALIGSVEGVAQVAAIAPDDGHGGRLLVACYAGAIDPRALRAALVARAPAHLVPAHLERVDAMPRNSSGKIDRHALERRPRSHAAAAGDPPRDDRERAVAAAWQAVLGAGAIGRDDGFAELGGTSLAAIRVAARLREALGVEVPATDVLAHPTVAALAAQLATRRPHAGARPPVVASGAPLPPTLPLSYYQLPYWIIRALTGDVSVVTEVFALPAGVDLERLQAAFAATVAGLDTLWMALPRWRPVQHARPRHPARFAIVDRRGDERPLEAIVQDTMDALSSARFELGRPPHVHAAAVRLPRGATRLLVAIPHVAIDLAGIETLRRELEARYLGRAPPVTAATIADQIAWERRPARAAELDLDARYWQRLGGGPSTVVLPARWFTAKHAGRRARALSSHPIAPALVDALAVRARATATSVPMLLVAAVYAALARAIGGDPTVLLMIDKREHATRALVATLTGLVRVHVRGARDATLAALVDAIAVQLLASHGHADHVMARAQHWNDRPAPRWLRAAVRAAGRALARRWPEARLDGDDLAGLAFALAPWRAGLGDRAVLVALNILPEVFQPVPAGAAIAPARRFEALLRPGDPIIGRDPVLDRTLQIHVTRDGEALAVNLYGGAVDQAGLDELVAAIARVLAELAAGA